MQNPLSVDVPESIIAGSSSAQDSLDNTIKKIFHGAGISFVGKVTSTGLKYFTQMAIACIFGADFLGLYTIGIGIYQLGELFSGMGLHFGTVHFVSIYHNSGDEKRLKGVLFQAVGLPFIGGLLLGISLFLASDFITQTIYGRNDLVIALQIFAIALPIGASMNVLAFSTTGFHIAKYLVYILELLQPFLNLLFIILVCLLGLGLNGAASAWLFSVTLGLIVAIYFLRKIYPPIIEKDVKSIFEVKKILSFSIPILLGEFLWFVLLWTDILMLGYFRSASEVGIYRAASQTAFLLIIFRHSLNTIFAPVIAKLYSRKEFKKIEYVFQTVTRWSFSLTFPLFLIVVINSKDLLQIFGPEFSIGWLSLVILATGQIVNVGTGGVDHMLVMSKHQYHKLCGDLVLTITNVVLNILWIPKWGIIGAAMATGISIAGVNLLRIVQVYLVLDVQPYNQSYLKAIGAGGFAMICGIIVRNLLLPMHFVISLIVTACNILLIYTFLLWLFRLEEADQKILGKIHKQFCH